MYLNRFIGSGDIEQTRMCHADVNANGIRSKNNMSPPLFTSCGRYNNTFYGRILRNHTLLRNRSISY